MYVSMMLVSIIHVSTMHVSRMDVSMMLVSMMLVSMMHLFRKIRKIQQKPLFDIFSHPCHDKYKYKILRAMNYFARGPAPNHKNMIKNATRSS